jgi:hypothetical protein
MPYALPDGRTLPMDTPWEYENINYPANWLRLSTEVDRDRLGIVWINPPEPCDERFYWGRTEDGELIPKDHAQLVDQWVAQTRTTANTLLAPTDWIIIREADNGKAADPVLKTWREEVRLAAGSKVFEIKQTADTPALAAYITGADYPAWPVDPYAPRPAEPVPADDVEPAGDGGFTGSHDAGLE